MRGQTRLAGARAVRRASAVAVYHRSLALVLLPFLVVASFLLYVLPGETDTLFAWTIEPPLTAMLLGSAYLGGIWFFGASTRVGSWRAVRRGMPAVLVFASLLLAATLQHLDRFHAGHPSFIAWIALYLVAPVFVLIEIRLHRRVDDGSDAPREYRIPLPLRVMLATLGLIVTAAGLALFLAPALVLDAWPWALTPLTAQVIGAVLTLPGVVNAHLLIDARWSAFRTVFQAQLFSLVFIIGALLVTGKELGETPGAVALPTFIGIAALAYASFYIHCETRIATPGASPDRDGRRSTTRQRVTPPGGAVRRARAAAGHRAAR
ncbi:hypothetical protein SAMN06295885_2070 [Rathayibacter oskolensis]|uniref:Uncharacterized protein n=1 Tax=Rathayibacter oskolensis TaxID=1891671 RepID=A0A1X7NXY4_9MICO|nr:hypothetical protein [Rathayibacter oskolensis]SMH42819.1 hypothetical protein SAMN06295885_2070 [Rathayibacter oskolensis]